MARKKRRKAKTLRERLTEIKNSPLDKGFFHTVKKINRKINRAVGLK